jgi:hypothetical protein
MERPLLFFKNLLIALSKVVNVKKILFSAYIKNWLNDIKSSVELSTWNGYEYIINKHVV